jgi:hypothetical protein
VHRKPIIAYSDAEWTVGEAETKTGLGAILFHPDLGVKAAALRDTPPQVLDSLNTRETQIIPLELLASAGLFATFGHCLRGEEVLFFIDNQSVCAALAKGASSSADIQAFATAWHAQCFVLGVRVWIEWIPSAANPADELSREGTSRFTRSVPGLVLPRWADRNLSRSLADMVSLITDPSADD